MQYVGHIISIYNATIAQQQKYAKVEDYTRSIKMDNITIIRDYNYMHSFEWHLFYSLAIYNRHA